MDGITPASLINIGSGLITIITLLTFLWSSLRISYNPNALNLQAELAKGTAAGLLEMAKQAKRESRTDDEFDLLVRAERLLQACGAWNEQKTVLRILANRYMEQGETAREEGRLDAAVSFFKSAMTYYSFADDTEGRVASAQAYIPIEAELGSKEALNERKDEIAQFEALSKLVGMDVDIRAEVAQRLKETSQQWIVSETKSIRKHNPYKPHRWRFVVLFIVVTVNLIEIIWQVIVSTPHYR